MDADDLALVQDAMNRVRVYFVPHCEQFLAEVAGLETLLWALDRTEALAIAGLEVVVRARLLRIYREAHLR